MGWYNHVPSYNGCPPKYSCGISIPLMNTGQRLRHAYRAQVPKDKEELASLQARLRKRFPVDAYNKARKELDPSRILSNNKLEKLFPLSDTI
ncbi:hypothetical protein Prudu_019111 [Prunus dulcis]|uniref:Uncharacterized protein n=1 Tax=Prunus dulcis TaxID=3755 RepID=A0A4Y1RTY5_PRUDU|nr:hypothetical protein Prudu_019111 [Prunus dulcis]